MVLTLGLVVIASVLLHEGGHALAAKRLGWRVVALRITRRGPALDIRTRDPQVLRTAWGVAAFLAAGITVPVYFLRYWLTRRAARD